MSATRREWLWLLVIGTLAFIARFVPALLWPSVNWPDEIFQTLEPAHRAAFGYGMISWEFREGARSWLFPGALAVVMRGTEWVLPGAWGYFVGVTFALTLLSTAPVLAVWAWARRSEIPATQALWIAASLALFCDLVYFGPKSLTEVVAGHLLFSGIYFARFHDARRIRLIFAGILLGASVVLRVHLAPSVAVGVLLSLRGSPKKTWFWIAATAMAVVVLAGCVDLATWGRPFGSYWAAFRYNVIQGNGARWGTSPVMQYIGWYGNVWGPGLAFAAIAVAFGWRTEPVLAMSALTVIATHSVLPHKEFRFVFPATVLWIAFCALVGARWIERVIQARPRLRSAAGPALFACFCLWSGFAWAHLDPVHTGNFFGPNVRTSHFRWLAGRRQAMLALSIDSDVCGVALVQIPWFLSGGYSHFHRNVPIVLIDTPERFMRWAPSFNTVVARGRADLGSEYSFQACYGDACVYRRAGLCAPAAYDVNRVIQELER